MYWLTETNDFNKKVMKMFVRIAGALHW